MEIMKSMLFGLFINSLFGVFIMFVITLISPVPPSVLEKDLIISKAIETDNGRIDLAEAMVSSNRQRIKEYYLSYKEKYEIVEK